MMTRLKSMFLGTILTLIIFSTVALALMVVSEVQPVQADEVPQPAVTVVEEVEYARLVDATPRRDITLQRIAPLK